MSRYPYMVKLWALLALVVSVTWLFPVLAFAKVHHVNGLGRSVGKPALAYLRVRNEIRAVVIAGCGADTNASRFAEARPNAPGRCMVVLRADTGELSRKFTNGPDVEGDVPLSYPIVGGAQPIQIQAQCRRPRYVGDAAGNYGEWIFGMLISTIERHVACPPTIP